MDGGSDGEQPQGRNRGWVDDDERREEGREGGTSDGTMPVDLLCLKVGERWAQRDDEMCLAAENLC